MLRRNALTALAGLAVLAGVLAPGLAGTVAAAPSAQVVTSSTLTIRLNPSAPNSYALSGTVTNVPNNVQSAVVTLTLNSGQIATQIVGAANGWSFNFSSIPSDGWKQIAVTDTSVSTPQYVSAGANVGAYVYTNPYITPTYSAYNWTTGYPAYSYVPGTYSYSYLPANYVGYAYNAYCQSCYSGLNYPSLSSGFVPYGSSYYYRNGQYYFYPSTSAAASYYTTDYLNSYRAYVPSYTSTYYYTPAAYTSGYYYNPAYYFAYNSGSLGLIRN